MSREFTKKCCLTVASYVALAGLYLYTSLAYGSLTPLNQVLTFATENQKKIAWVDQQLRKFLSENKATTSEIEVQKLKKIRDEYLLRQEFYDRLAFFFESKYKNQPLVEFLRESFLQLSEIELKQASPSPLWKVYAHLHNTLGKISEKNENPLEIVDSYIDFAGLTQPASPEEFLASRHYTNGIKVEKAQTLNPHYLGEVVEKRMTLLKMYENIYFKENQKKKTMALPRTITQPIKITLKSNMKSTKPENSKNVSEPREED